MKAIVFDRYGGPEVLTFREMPKPDVAKGQILIEVHACGLNPVDFKIRTGAMKDFFSVAFPRILGGDIAGRVVHVGPGVNDFKSGDDVYFSNPLDQDGGYAEYCVVDESVVAKKPNSLSYLEAASIPVAGLTSLQSLRDFSKLESGQSVLIHAGAGGVGSFAIQYAKQLGAQVFTTASPSNTEYVKELGADTVIDYRTDDFVSVCQKAGGMDVVLDSIGGSNYFKSVMATKKGGAVPCIVNPPDEATKALARENNIVTDFFMLTCSRPGLDQITKLIEANKMRAPQISTLEMSDIKTAHEKLESGRTRGKLILKIK